MCPHCRAFIEAGDRRCPYCGEAVGAPAIQRRYPADVLGGLIPHAQFTTAMILVVNFGLFVATMLAGEGEGGMNVDGLTLFRFGAKYPPAILQGEWWRLITAGFLHGGIFHILMNSWALFDLGARVEEEYGTERMIVIYFFSTVFGFVASTWWSSALSIGASAAVFGLIGAMIALGVRHPTVAGAVKGLYMRWAIYGLLFGLLPGLRVDNAAHIGGLAAGFATAYVAGTPRVGRQWGERFWRVAMIVCLLITAWAFLQMFLNLTSTS